MGSSVQAFQVLYFNVGSTCIRALVWQTCKRHRSYSDPTLPHLGHMSIALQHLIFFAFYRTLFESFTSYTPFLLSAALSVATDILMYVVCLTDRFLDCKKLASSSLERGVHAVLLAVGCGWAAALVGPKYVINPYDCHCVDPVVFTNLTFTVCVHVTRCVEAPTASGEASVGDLNFAVAANAAAVAAGDAEAEAEERNELREVAAIEFIIRQWCNLTSVISYFLLHQLFKVPYVGCQYVQLDPSSLQYLAVSAIIDVLSVVVVLRLWKGRLLGLAVWLIWWEFLKENQLWHFKYLIVLSIHVQWDLLFAFRAKNTYFNSTFVP